MKAHNEEDYSILDISNRSTLSSNSNSNTAPQRNEESSKRRRGGGRFSQHAERRIFAILVACAYMLGTMSGSKSESSMMKMIGGGGGGGENSITYKSSASQEKGSRCTSINSLVAAQTAQTMVELSSSSSQPLEVSASSATTSAFAQIVSEASEFLKDPSSSSNPPLPPRKTFNVSTWDRKTTGGLDDFDRVVLSQIYANATSVFEYGLGESTYIANQVGVPRYAGIDSDAVWVSQTRNAVSHHFRFYFGDVGPTGIWGIPNKPKLTKGVWDYQLVPLFSESLSFDVYMVDGRWRLGCLLASFLHASDRGNKSPSVLLHDCYRSDYHRADSLFQVERLSKQLCRYKRKDETTDGEIKAAWEHFASDSS